MKRLSDVSVREGGRVGACVSGDDMVGAICLVTNRIVMHCTAL